MPGYTLADGETLKNKLGATTVDELEKREADVVARRILEIELGHGPKGNFDVAHLKAFHQYMFQGVFEWAGHTRDERVSLSDGAVASEPLLRRPGSEPFMLGPAIASALEDWATRLGEAHDLCGLPRKEFAERAADAMAELNCIHPFREGNGRTQRVFMRELAKEAGHELDFSVVSKERMARASIAANERGDPSMMRRMFDEISDPVRAGLLREAIDKLQAAFDREGGLRGQEPQKWNDLYVATLSPGHEVELVFAGVAGDQFMARTQDQILFGRTEDLRDPHPERGTSFVFTVAPAEKREHEVERDAGTDGDPARDYVRDELKAAEAPKPIDPSGPERSGGRGR